MRTENDIKSTIRTNLTKSEAERVKVKQKKSKILMITDMHGLNRYQATRLINNLTKMNNEPFTIGVIHGFNHGTVLKNTIRNELHNDRIKKIYGPNNNPGLTYLKVA